MVHLLQESLLDVFTNETGAVDCSRKGGISLSKQVSGEIPLFVFFQLNLVCLPFAYLSVGENAGESVNERKHPPGQ